MKCPICKKEIKGSSNSIIVCNNCGFDDIRYEFINDEERNYWENYIVKPCMFAYNLNKKQEQKIKDLEKQIATLKKYDAGKNVTKDNETKSLHNQPSIEMKEGWNYDDPIAHPNSSEGNCNGTKFRISDISVVMTDTKKATVYFLVQKISNKSWGTETDSFAVRYRVKDENGVIVLNETKSISGLMPGDVSREKIELTGVVPGKYSIDIVSYN